MEVAFVSAGVLLFGPPQDPSKAVASRRLLPSLLLGILRKLSGRGGAEERLLQPLGRACLSVAGEMVGGILVGGSLLCFYLFILSRAFRSASVSRATTPNTAI